VDRSQEGQTGDRGQTRVRPWSDPTEFSAATSDQRLATRDQRKAVDNSSVILVADGLTPGLLDAAMRAGEVPALAALADDGVHHVLTTVFPSVTGVAYIPMLTGVHPADAGVPGLRWYDRSHRLPAILGHSRSYVGTQIRSINDDLSPTVATAFERAAGAALGMEAVVTRGLPAHRQLDRGVIHAARVIHAHVTGDADRWLALEEELAATLVRRIREERPRFVFAAFTGGDKAAHRGGEHAPGMMRSLKLVDRVVQAIREDAERDGRWSKMQLWVVSDHGHSEVHSHLDLAAELRDKGARVRSHPWTFPDQSQAAVMVSGNSMAHVYLGLDDRTRQPWSALQQRWRAETEWLWTHPAVDLLAAQTSPKIVAVWKQGQRGEISRTARGFSYRHVDGDPLGIDAFEDLCDEAVHDRSLATDYPDSVAQLAHLVVAPRSGDLVISATPGWDLRRQYEPIDHVSSHGALHAAHMLVPLVGNRRIKERPRRTMDLHQFVLSGPGLRRPWGFE
jgi:predicted AlkP superfamily pyrophosphatase or phosphodiesterase